MYGNPQRRTVNEAQELRREGGLWLKDLREHAGLTQKQMAAKLGLDYYTFISQLETGRGRIPPDRYLEWADIFGQNPKQFVQDVLRFYDPATHAILFNE